MSRCPLKAVVERLRARYGAPKAPAAKGPFELILWENCAYLVDEERRAEAFARLKKKTGLDPKRILETSQAALEQCVAAPGRMAAHQVEKLRASAEIAVRDFDGDLSSVLDLEAKKAVRALRSFRQSANQVPRRS